MDFASYRTDFFKDIGNEKVLSEYHIVRYNRTHNYMQVEIHAYCLHVSKNKTTEHVTYTKEWFDNRGNREEFYWSVEDNCVKTLNSDTAMYLDGVKYYDRKQYLEAKRNKNDFAAK